MLCSVSLSLFLSLWGTVLLLRLTTIPRSLSLFLAVSLSLSLRLSGAGSSRGNQEQRLRLSSCFFPIRRMDARELSVSHSAA